MAWTSIMDLMDEYGSLSDIPEDILATNGLVRITQNGAMRILQKSSLKFENTRVIPPPFDKISFKTRKNDTQLVRSADIVRRIHHSTNDYFHKCIDSGCISEQVFDSTQRDFFECNGTLRSIFTSIGWLWGDGYTEYINNLVESYIYTLLPEDYSDLTRFISDTWAPELFDFIQLHFQEHYDAFLRLRSQLQDRNMIEKSIDESIYAVIPHHDLEELVLEENEHFSPEEIDSGAATWFLLLIRTMETFFHSYWFDEIAASIKNIKNREELHKSLLLSVDKLPSFIEFKATKEEMKQQKTQAWKIELSKTLANKKDVFEKDKWILKSISQLAVYEDILLEKSKKINNEIGSLFLVNQWDKKYDTIILDGNPDIELDANPGLVSGDCTNGKPLPFWKMNGLSNIKVYANAWQHIGNIYLIETLAHWQKIWHIDAIQIPKNYNWDDATPELVQNLWKSAQKKWISKIVTSSQSSHISNYDYIVDAVKKYHVSQGWKTLGGWFLKHHNFSDESYSQLQSTGDSSFFILWSLDK